MIADVVLPCLDEAQALPWVLARMPAGCRPLVADNGSTDGSPDVALELGAEVVHVAERGYGAAVHAGLEAARSDLVCVMDADATLDPRELPPLLALVEGAHADMVLGRRTTRSSRAWSPSTRLANVALAAAVRHRTGLPLRDVSPMRVFRRVPMLALELSDRRSGYPLQTVLAAHHAGWRVTELPVTYRPRAGRSKVTGTLGGYVRAVRDMGAVLAR